jgi:hypothetical protein
MHQLSPVEGLSSFKGRAALSPSIKGHIQGGISMSTQTVNQADDTLTRVLASDLCQFGRDVGSCVTRVYLSYRLMVVFAVGNDVAFSTALMLGGARVFDTSTNWMQRSRAHLLTTLRGGHK